MTVTKQEHIASSLGFDQGEAFRDMSSASLPGGGQGAFCRLRVWLTTPVSAAPLAAFRVLFGAAMLISAIRFLVLGWLKEQYVLPRFHFTYYGFSWVTPLPEVLLYGVYGLMVLAAALVMIGLFYRIAAILFFLSFTYFELLDKAYYLNHYYFVSVTALLLCVLPAAAAYSLDSILKGSWKETVPRWAVAFPQLQLAIVYVYAGIAKITPEWLFEALPLRIWLPAHTHLPLIGPLLGEPLIAYLFSWVGMLYDCTIVFFLLWKRTRVPAYLTVIGFHLMTGLLFQIGVFPLVMIMLTPVYFSASFHERWLTAVCRWGSDVGSTARLTISSKWSTIRLSSKVVNSLRVGFFSVFFAIQIIVPFRFLFYPGPLLWREEGYRFSWRVMLMEKSGEATFYVQDRKSGREGIVFNRDFLNATQEKQMAFQPDMILEFAHFLHRHYQAQGIDDPIIRAEVYVTLNARPSAIFIDPTVDLSRENEGFHAKSWIMPYPY